MEDQDLDKMMNELTSNLNTNNKSKNNNNSKKNNNANKMNNKNNSKNNNNSNNANANTNNTNKKNNKPKENKKNVEKKVKEEQTKKSGEKRVFKLADPLIVYKDLHGKPVKSKDPRGKYTDLTPGGAARKMFRRIARSRQIQKMVEEEKLNSNGKFQKLNKISNVVKGADKNVVFSVIELDDNGNEVKRFYYKGSNKLDEPITDKFIGFNIKTGKKKTSVQWVVPSIHSIEKEEYEAKIKNQL